MYTSPTLFLALRGLIGNNLLSEDNTHKAHTFLVESVCFFTFEFRRNHMSFPLTKNLMIYTGDSFTFTTSYKGDEDLLTATALCQFRQDEESPNYLVELVGIIDEQNKTITFNLTSQQTQTLRVSYVEDCGFSTVVYDTQLTFENGVVETTQKGKGRIYHDVTRA